MLIAGLDEAGRGPVIGPLVIGCVIFNQKDLNLLDEWGIDDSKKISKKKRNEYARIIKKNCLAWKIIQVSAKEINNLHYANNLSLNQIEEISFAKLLNSFSPKPDVIYLDACDPIEDRFGQSIAKLLSFKPKKIISKHRGDSIFKIVGASSIIAKTERDLIIDGYKEIYGNCGSGYPSDKYTRSFLETYFKEKGKFPPITRTWWKTAINIKNSILEKKKQKRLTDF